MGWGFGVGEGLERGGVGWDFRLGIGFGGSIWGEIWGEVDFWWEKVGGNGGVRG